MKKYITAFLFIISLNCYSQVIVFRGSEYGLSTLPQNDPGTNSYSFSIFVPNTGTFHFNIFRYGGYWFHTETGFGITYVKDRTVDQHFSSNPPCLANWYNGLRIGWSFGISNFPAVMPDLPPSANYTTFLPRSITGNCTSSVSIVLSPYYLTPPSLTTIEIDALVGVPIGSIVWDSTFMCLKVYNGTVWICL